MQRRLQFDTNLNLPIFFTYQKYLRAQRRKVRDQVRVQEFRKRVPTRGKVMTEIGKQFLKARQSLR